MKSNKLIFTLILVLTLCISVLFAFTGCKDDTVTDLYIKNSDQPRLTYVQGQDFDLTGGIITYVLGEETLTIPMDSEGVSITGYDKNTIGAQTVTVTYMEKSTTLNVNVVARITAENFETKYFIDDAFNKSKGRLRIANDDATYFTVNMSDEAVSLVSFDSSAAGEKAVTVKYEKNGASYECVFNVNVYGIQSVILTAPPKTNYYSHESELDFSGGYLTVKSTDSSLSKFVNLTADMIEGFDISAATKENHDTPLAQTLTINYGGQTFTFKINITYSGVSIINDAIEKIKDVDFEAEGDIINDEQGEAVLEAILEYYELSAADKALLNQSDVTKLVRASAIYVNRIYLEELETYNKSIKVNTETGAVYLTCSSYEDTLADYKRLNDDGEKLTVYAEILNNLVEDFPKIIVTGETTVEGYVLVLQDDLRFFLIDMFKHLTDLYELLADIPDEWTSEDLEKNGDNILRATMDIITADYVVSGYSYFYTSILTDWRENKDYLDILYYYFANVKEDNEFIAESMFEKVPLPGKLDDWYTYVVLALQESRYMEKYEASESYFRDITFFMYYNMKAYEAAKEVKNSDNELHKKIYDILDVDYILEYNLMSSSRGYLYQCGSLIDSEAFLNVWEKYLALYDKYETDGLDLTKDAAAFRETLDAFLTLSPSELYGFNSSLNYLYDTSRGNILIMDYDAQLSNIFIDMMRQYLQKVLNDTNEPLLLDLFRSMENYSLVSIKKGAIDEFKSGMKSLTEAYAKLSAEDKANFDEYLGVAYEKYVAIYNVIAGNTTANAGDMEAKLTELHETITKFYKVYNAYSELDSEEDADAMLHMRGLIIALFERVNELYAEISASDNAGALTALYAKYYTVNSEEMSLDNGYFTVRSIVFNTIMYALQFEVTDAEGNKTHHIAWIVYDDSNADKFFTKTADLLYAMYDTEAAMPTAETVIEIIKAYNALDFASLNRFCAFEGDLYYYEAIRKFFNDNLSDSADAVAVLLCDADEAYVSYTFSKDDKDLETFKTKMAEAIAAYEAAVSEDDAKIIGALYDHYLEVYNGLNVDNDTDNGTDANA